jgi:hypothetical protein
MCKIFIVVFLMLMYEKSYAMVCPITLQLLYVKNVGPCYSLYRIIWLASWPWELLYCIIINIYILLKILYIYFC